MPRKKLSPSNRSTKDEGYSEEFESDSSLELNSRRNTYRKKPQRKCFLKQSQNNSLGSTEKRQREILERNSLEQNEKRPSIIKIFRRIDRKAKNIYLVDDKVEDRSELVTPSDSKNDANVSNKKGPRLSKAGSLEPTSDRKCLSKNCTAQTALKKFQEHPKRTLKAICRKHDCVDVEIDVWNLPDDHDVSDPSSIDKLAKKTEIVVSNQPCVTDIAETPDRDDAWNQPRDTDNLYSLGTRISETASSNDARNQPRNTHGLYSPVTDIAETSSSDDAWNQPRATDNLYSSVTDIAEISGSDDSWNQPLNTHGLYSPVTDIAETSSSDDAWNQSHDTDDLFFPVTDIAQKHCMDDIWNHLRVTADLYTSEADQTPSKSDVYNQRLNSDSDDKNSLEMDIGKTLSRADVYIQVLNSDFDVPVSSVTEIVQTSSKFDAFERLNSDLCVSSDDEIPNY